MPFMYEALVGHLFIVNGRTLRTSPPGARVQVAPKRAGRGREADTFFCLVMPSGDVAPTAFYEQMAALAAERYFESAGSVTAGLRAVFDTLNRNLLDHNRTSGGRTFEANILCVVLHDTTLTLGRVGMCAAVLRTDAPNHPQGQYFMFPTDPVDDYEFDYGAPLGVLDVPAMKFKQYPISAGARLLLADANIDDMVRTDMFAAMRAPDVSDMLIELKRGLIEQATVMGVEFIAPEEAVPLPTLDGESSAQIAATGGTAALPQATVEINPGVGTRLVDTVSAGRDRAQAGLSGASAGIAKSARMTSNLIDHYFGTDEDEAREWWSTPMAAGVAAAIPLVVVALVLVLWLTGIDRSEFETCVIEANDDAQFARSIDSSDVNGTIAAWQALLVKVDECEEKNVAEAEDTTLVSLTREGQSVIDRLLNITRRDAVPIASFPSASLSRGVLRGLNLYVLDSANDIVYEAQITPDGRGITPNTQSPIPNMRRNATVNQYTVDELVDIAWAEDGSGLSQGNVLIALDRNGVIVEHSPTILTRGAQRLLGTENWVAPSSMRIWRGNLYLLVPGANQIWRYEPTGGTYGGAPTEYFGGQTRPNIRNAVDFDIDPDGAVFVLFGDGQVGKYISGEPQGFGFANFPPGQELVAADSMYLSSSPISQGLYIANALNGLGTIYELTWAGTFMRSYRTFEEEQFASLADVIVDDSQQVVYALSGNSVFVFGREG